jgi:hypothetical protein
MIYWILVKKNFDRGAYVPSYEILTTEPPEGKKEALPPGYYLDLWKCALSTDGSYIIVNQYRVSNIDGVIDEQHTETYTLDRTDGSPKPI